MDDFGHQAFKARSEICFKEQILVDTQLDKPKVDTLRSFLEEKQTKLMERE